MRRATSSSDRARSRGATRRSRRARGATWCATRAPTGCSATASACRAHNDVRLTDESVSETHAKLQRRDDGWYLVDMDSTNGSYVGGTRVVGERRIEGSPDLRFGGVKMRFSPVGGRDVDVEAKGTHAI